MVFVEVLEYSPVSDEKSLATAFGWVMYKRELSPCWYSTDLAGYQL